eukprot:jgi/Mesvir1/24243/Mv10947-RA.1
MAAKPKLNYFQLRGRGEPIRLVLEQLGVEYEDTGVPDGPGLDYPEMKRLSGTEHFPFGQCPVYEDEGITIAQLGAIMRHLGRKYKLYGDSLAEAALIDMYLLGIEDIYMKYIFMIYTDQLAPEAKTAYFNTHLKPESAFEKVRGAHVSFLNNILLRNNGGKGFAVGSRLSIADISLWHLTDCLIRVPLYPKEMKELYPALVAHHARISALPNVAKYLASSRRPEKVNGNGLGQ